MLPRRQGLEYGNDAMLPLVPIVALVLLLRAPALHAADVDFKQVGTIRPAGVRESSGVAPCRFDPQIFWTQTDGRKPVLFAMDRQGGSHGQVVVDVALNDWEDLASDHAGHLYIADTGNNGAVRTQLAVHQIDEPDPKSLPSRIKTTQSWTLTFPKEPFDCESLFIWQGHGYVISKIFNNGKASLYRFPLTPSSKPVMLERVSKLKIESPVTSASLSLDGLKMAVLTKNGPGVLDMSGDWKLLSQVKPTWTKFKHEHAEGCCFVPEGLLVTTESREIYLFSGLPFQTASPARQ